MYRYRRRLPGETRGREVVVSLCTRAFREAEHRAALLDREFDRALARARVDVAQAGKKTDLNAILRGYLRGILEGDGAGRPPLSMTSLRVLEHQLAKAREALANRDFGPVVGDLNRLAALHGVPAEDRFGLGIGVLEARVHAHQAAIRQVIGDMPAVFTERDEPANAPAGLRPPSPSTEGVAPAPTPEPSPVPTASALVEPFFVRRETIDRLSHHDMSQERTTLRLFMDVCGDKPVNAYGRGDVTRFLDMLRQLPKTYGKSTKDRDRRAADIIAAAPADAPRLTDKTVKRHHTALTQFLRFAVDGGHLTVAQHTELTAKHRFREEQKARDQRDTWTPEELRTLFRSPVWTGCAGPNRRSEPGSHIIRDARFWLPILALYHGARLEEFADLYRRDVWHDEGTWALRLVETKDNGEAGDRSLKSEAATRVIPLHAELIRLGFLAYVAKTAPNPNDPLFPDLAPQGKDCKRGPRITRWFVEYRRAIKVFRPGVAMHAFRHNAITRLRDTITDHQQERHVDFLMGHARQGSEGAVRYDKGPGLKAVAATLALLSYPEVDLSGLHVAGESDDRRAA
ncbi:site-specific integrase [Roseomonas stagni]|uniref:Site-specific integrase n=2 Tax=Falsiroseomonas algicola TaxID=2716930 RepID=A0A6M1LJF0_9PROT|nr:site-specific integrase [Falsiroseomonas algicola]